MSPVVNARVSTDTPRIGSLVDTIFINNITILVPLMLRSIIVHTTNPQSHNLFPQLYFYFFYWHHYYILSIATLLYPNDGHRALSRLIRMVMDPLNNMSYLIPFGSITFVTFQIHDILYHSFISMHSVTFFIHAYHPSLLAFLTFLLVVSTHYTISMSISISAYIYIHIHTSNPTSIHPNWKEG